MAQVRDPKAGADTIWIQGDLEQTIQTAAAFDKLTAAAKLHHAFSFDEVGDWDSRLEYEPRCSTACPKCHTIWVGSKAGEILRLRLDASRLAPQRTRFKGGVRALAHIHRLGQVIAGLDIGYVLVLDEDNPVFGGSGGHCHPARSHAAGEGPRLVYQAGFAIRDSMKPERFMHGITAILELPADDDDPNVDVVVLTRAPEMLVVRLERTMLTVMGRQPLPGWGRSLTLTGARCDEALVCVTRSGEIYEWRCRDLRANPAAAPFRTRDTNLLATAVAAPAGARCAGHALLVGASDGLYICRAGGDNPVHVPVTRGAVLSIATVAIQGPGDPEPLSYIALGLEDGRLRVLEEHVLFDWLDGKDVLAAQDFRVRLGDAVLTLEILAFDDPRARFVLAGLRNHQLRLFHVRTRESLLRDLLASWREQIDEPDPASRPDLAPLLDTLLANESKLRGPVGTKRDNALRYLLVDEVLPRWTRALGRSDPRIVRRACDIAKGADDKVLYRLSATMGDIAAGDASALIQLSRACLVAMPQRDADRWRAFVSYHLRRLHACGRRKELVGDRPRLQHWSRFVRKYLLLGETFADKRYSIDNLVKRNRATGKYLDALIYATQLAHQRYDFKWSTIAHCDEHDRPQEIVRADLIDEVAIVVTAAAQIVFYNVRGKRLEIRDAEGGVHTYLAPERGRGVTGDIRTRAARFSRKDGPWVRIALSWAGEGRLEPGRLHVTIFDLRLDARGVELDAVSVPISRVAACDAAGIEVHGLVGLPDADAFLVGLDSSESPLALLKLCERRGEASRWELLALEMARGPGSASALPTAQSTPVRAVAAFGLDASGYFLAGAGGADGSLRFAVFDLDGHVVAVDAEPTLLVYPINDIALAARRGDPRASHVCYVGTATGESLCLLLHIEPEAPPEARAVPDARPDPRTKGDMRIRIEPRIRKIVATHLWRDLHTAPVIAVRPTIKSVKHKEKPLYPDDVVFVATQDGHVSIYHAAAGDPATSRLSESSNYYFQGMRFDRINLKGGLTSWAIRRSRSGFLAAYPGGELCFGELHAPRGSARHRGNGRVAEKLYQRVMHATVFYGADANDTQKLEICSMIRIGGGALRSYLLREQLQRENWRELDVDRIESILRGRLDELSAEDDEERDRIRAVIETVSKQLLDRDLEALSDDCRPGKVNDRMTVYPRVWRTCQVLTRYLLDAAMRSQPGAVRVRMTLVHALLRVNVLWHAALDEQSERNIPRALREVLTTCLRDDDRIVRVEALHAVAVALRNISVLIERAKGEHRNQLRASFFPLGLATIQWLLGTILENYSRYRRRTEPVLLTPWSYVTVLAGVIRLFPGDALEVCEQISRWGLGDNLELIADLVRGDRVAAIRDRIRDLWIVPALRQPAQARDEFIGVFSDFNLAERLAGYGVTPRDTDYARASGLLQVYRRLALLWSVNHEAEIVTGIPVRYGRSSELRELTGSLACLQRILDGFVEVARSDDQIVQLNRLRTEIDEAMQGGQQPPGAVRFVLDRVVEHWQSVLEPAVPTTGGRIGGYVLGGVLGERPNGLLHKLDNLNRVIKVLRYPHSEARSEFYRDARLSRELAERYDQSFVRVHDVDPTSGYVVMDRFEVASECPQIRDAHDADERRRNAQIAAAQLSRALHCLHVEGLAHGDVRAENVFVGGSGAALAFRLGDLHARATTASRSTAALQIPGFLRIRVPENVRPDQWIDLLCLTLFLLWVLTGETPEPDANIEQLRGLASDLAQRAEQDESNVGLVIAQMLGDQPYKTAREFEDAIVFRQRQIELPKFVRHALAGRVLARYDVFISYDGDDQRLALDLCDQLTERGLVPYIDVREVRPDIWSPRIAHAIDQSRSFAILVGDNYREDRYQAREVAVAREDATRDRLPFNVFLLDEQPPRPFHNERVIKVGRDAKAMADRIVRSFQHPIEIRG